MDESVVISTGSSLQGLDRFRGTNPFFSITCTLSANHSYAHRERCLADCLITADNCYGHQALIDMVLHVAAWQHCVRTKATTHIVDDEVVLRHDFARAIHAFVSTQDEFDLIVWSTDLTTPAQIRYAPGVIGRLFFGRIGSVSELDKFRDDTTDAQRLQLLQCGVPLGYTLTPRGAEILLARCLPFGVLPLTYFGQTDTIWANTGHFIEMARHYPGMRASILQPVLGVLPSNADLTDNIGHFRKALTHLCISHSRFTLNGQLFSGQVF